MVQSVVVIGGNDAIMLGVIRAVGSCGYKVIVIHLCALTGKGATQLDYYCRYVSSFHCIEKGSRKALIDLLLTIGKEESLKPVIITLDDYASSVVDNNLRLLEISFLVQHIRHEEGAIVALMNKHVQKELAKSAGFNVVPGWPIYCVGGRYVIPENIQYPCFVKGLTSYDSNKKNQRKCSDAEELAAHLEKCANESDAPLYAESFIEMDKEMGVLGTCKDGVGEASVLAELLVMGRGFSQGVSMFGKVSPIDRSSDLAEKVRRLLKNTGYTGIFNLDIVESKGQLYFVEMNFRYAAYGYAVFSAGYNVLREFINILTQCDDPSRATWNQSFYFNNKIGCYGVADRAISIKEYFGFKRKADYSLVDFNSDPKPYFVFLLRCIALFIRSRVRRTK